MLEEVEKLREDVTHPQRLVDYRGSCRQRLIVSNIIRFLRKDNLLQRKSVCKGERKRKKGGERRGESLIKCSLSSSRCVL